MPTISPSDLLRQKRLQLITNATHVQESTTGMAHRLAVTMPIKLSSVNHSKFTVTPSQKSFTTGVTVGPLTHSKMR
jgi:hypothetical protein